MSGTDVDAKTLDEVKAGADFVTIDPEHFLKGYVATALLIKSVTEKTPAAARVAAHAGPGGPEPVADQVCYEPVSRPTGSSARTRASTALSWCVSRV